MKLDSMKPPRGSRQKQKRIGRGPGSGLGKTSARGHKGQRSRSGGKSTVGFEGGQMPMARRLPKRGFKNPFRIAFQVVNVQDLNRFAVGAAVESRRAARVGARHAAHAHQGARSRQARSRAHGARSRVLGKRFQGDQGGRRSDRAGRASGDGLGVRGRTKPSSYSGAAPAPRLHVDDAGRPPCRRRDSDPRDQRPGSRRVLPSGPGHRVRHGEPILGRRARALLHLRARHHALRVRVHHPPADDSRDPVSRAVVEGGRAGSSADHAVHALRHRHPRARAGALHLSRPRADSDARRRHRSSAIPAGASDC